MEIYERIKVRREELGLSAAEVAAALHVSKATIYRYESADIEKLPADHLVPLSQILKCTPAYIMGWVDSPFASAIGPREDAVLLSPDEHDLVKRYRALDDAGKSRVWNTLDFEFSQETSATSTIGETEKAVNGI